MENSKTMLDLLLSVDTDKIVKPQKQVEIKRLSKIVGEPVVFTCQAITAEDYHEIQEGATRISRKGDIDIDTNEIQAFAILKGVANPDLKDKELCQKYNALTPRELIDKLLLAGEIANLYEAISELSGFGEDSVSEIKNE